MTSTAISPGITKTEFLQVAGQEATFYQRMMMMDSETVAALGIRAMLRRRRSVVPGFLNAATALFTRLMPRRLATWVAYQTMKGG